MKRILLMLIILSSLSFSAMSNRGADSGDFYELYKSTYDVVTTPEMHRSVGLEADEVKVVKEIINKGWYELKILEADKLKEMFAIDKLLIDGPGNKKKIDKHIKNIRKINAKMDNLYEKTNKELNKHIEVDKLR